MATPSSYAPSLTLLLPPPFPGLLWDPGSEQEATPDPNPKTAVPAGLPGTLILPHPCP
jgi:hypothetical protein